MPLGSEDHVQVKQRNESFEKHFITSEKTTRHLTHTLNPRGLVRLEISMRTIRRMRTDCRVIRWICYKEQSLNSLDFSSSSSSSIGCWIFDRQARCLASKDLYLVRAGRSHRRIFGLLIFLVGPDSAVIGLTWQSAAFLLPRIAQI